MSEEPECTPAVWVHIPDGSRCFYSISCGGTVPLLSHSLMLDGSRPLCRFLQEAASGRKKTCRLLDFGVQKYTLYSYYISNFFLPHPSPPPSPQNRWHSHVTGHTVTTANQSSPAERRQPNKEEQKESVLSVSFLVK